MSEQRNYPDSSWAFIPATETRASHHYCPRVRATLGGFPPRHLVFLVRWSKRKPASTAVWRPVHHVSHFSAPSLLHMCPLPGSPPSQNSFFSKHWEDLGFALQFPTPHWQLMFMKKIFICGWVFVAAYGLSLVVTSEGSSSLRVAGFSLGWLFLWWTTGFSNCGAISCSAACGVFLDQRWNLCSSASAGGGGYS